MRRVLGLLAAVGLLTAIFPVTATAAEPIRHTLTQTGVRCELSTEAGFIGILAETVESEGFADLVIWGPGTEPYEDLPTIVTVGSTMTLDASSLAAAFDLAYVQESKDPEEPPVLIPAGSARIGAQLIPLGPAEDFGSRELRDGNRRYRLEQTLEILLDLLDGTREEFDLAAGCVSSIYASTTFGTNPNGWVTNGEQLFISCEWMTEHGAIAIFAINDQYGAFSQTIIGRGDRVLVGLTVPELTETTYQAYNELFDPAVGGDTVGIAIAHATLSRSGDRITDHEWVEPYRLSAVGERLSVDGTLTVNVDGSDSVLVMDDTSCRAGDVRIQVLEKMPRE
jgi:hypothetical protein